jgi:multimeric flavodoxin WrbA
MKVLLLNGSPHAAGCTYTALAEAEAALEKNGVGTEWFHIGGGMVRGCSGCRACAEKGLNRCVFDDDAANRLIDALNAADGVLVGSPVYYAGPNGALCALLDRVFFASGHRFAGKPAAAIASCRRAGATAALDRLLKYFTISRMPVISSQYWPMVHGNSPQEVRQDAEGLQIMRVLGAEMARALKALQSAPPVEAETRVRTNFIR